jgi:hypothetical protein
MIWEILFLSYLLGAAIISMYFIYKGLRACIRTAFGFKPQRKIWKPFNYFYNATIRECLNREEYFNAILNTLACGGMFGIIYPIYLPIYFVRQPIKTFIKTLAYKIVTTKEEKVQRALGTDRPEKSEKNNASQTHLLQQALSSGSSVKFHHTPQQLPQCKWVWDK